jgi:hypothetical protein
MNESKIVSLPNEDQIKPMMNETGEVDQFLDIMEKAKQKMDERFVIPKELLRNNG